MPTRIRKLRMAARTSFGDGETKSPSKHAMANASSRFKRETEKETTWRRKLNVQKLSKCWDHVNKEVEWSNEQRNLRKTSRRESSREENCFANREGDYIDQEFESTSGKMTWRQRTTKSWQLRQIIHLFCPLMQQCKRRCINDATQGNKLQVQQVKKNQAVNEGSRNVKVVKHNTATETRKLLDN